MKYFLQKNLSKGVIALAAAIGGACLEATTDILKKNVEPALLEAKYSLEDWWSPLAPDALLGISLNIYAPTEDGKLRPEGASAAIPVARCRDPNWPGLVTPYSNSSLGFSTKAIISIHCRASGRISIDLLPQYGDTVRIFEGHFKDGEKVAFPGVADSYSAGVLVLHHLSNIEPVGPRVPVNKCQLTDSCNPEDWLVD
ncbi:hypothetical protein DNK06_13160 [Pseudomonas daroniae]|uniref:Uncharacterized protein n=1 Tax=Phytopseudomonas daroniae TaxID=2487519 RepID=A0A4Q9QKW7_9GAMM|nr:MULTISPECIES: hypothetical protein [Pseudomonas]TBU79353.1 hypothetical protein DNK06_13160 [Pseudomonas daroniae]TBU79437.1 hypothetical protein DNK31_19375 [Pseudomonas sp. FRB 228]TBU91453.1 hypothetical protein DNJ99_10680 [Pseudomonas daroniae]